MNNCADLEINIRRKDADSYSIDFRFLLPGSDAETRLISVSGNQNEARSPTAIQIDRVALAVLGIHQYDDNEYGKLLRDSLFQHEALRSGFQEAVHQAQAAETALRVRLFIAPDCPELYSLQWERLAALDKDNEERLLFTGEQ
ncbi:MAG: hypothetical protein D3923_18715, partial [Candidatus Electrothrix sp. AR3]|nr:hypothetical protein [Candidatus Electrothrix sp. AR3]